MGSGNEGSAIYRALHRLTRAVVGNFYRDIEATGLEHLEGDRATILAPTHPNSIIDPLMVGLFEERPIRFIARHGLFAIPGFGALLRAVGAIPIQRRMDHSGKQVDNQGAFGACRQALREKGMLVIFPEGKTHSRLRVEPIKTGVARIALDAVAGAGDGEGEPGSVRVVPVGLNYLVRHAFRSDVHVAFGEPIEVDRSFLPAEGEDPKEAVRRLTALVEERLRALTVHVEQEDDERLIAQVTAIIVGVRAEEGLDPKGQSPAERVALTQRVIDAYRWLSHKDPERTRELRQRVIDFLDEREALGLGGENPALQHRGERKLVRKRLGKKRTAFLIFGAPLALWGLAHHALPYSLLRILLRFVKPTFYRAALLKLLGGLGIFLACYALQIGLAWSLLGPLIAIPYGLSLLPTGLFALRYLSEMNLHRFGPNYLLRRIRHRSRIAMLRAERDLLKQELAELRKEYLGQLEGQPEEPPTAEAAE